MTKPSSAGSDAPAEDAGLPLPGRPVPGSDTGRPIMAALNLLSRRWVLRILWELRDGAVGFRDLQGRCDRMSPNTLSTRLSELKTAGVVAHDRAGDWALTPLGRSLGPTLDALLDWSDVWARSLASIETAAPDAALGD